MAHFKLDGAVMEREVPPLSFPGVRMSPDRDWIDNYRNELDGYLKEMTELTGMMPDEVFMRLSAFSARAAEMRSQLVRTDSRRSNAFRTQEIDKFIEECDRQFRVHSRLQAIREMEARMAGGFA